MGASVYPLLLFRKSYGGQAVGKHKLVPTLLAQAVRWACQSASDRWCFGYAIPGQKVEMIVPPKNELKTGNDYEKTVGGD